MYIRPIQIIVSQGWSHDCLGSHVELIAIIKIISAFLNRN